MTKEDQIYVDHVLDCIADIERYVGTDRARFLGDDMACNACLRQLQIMAESCTRLSDAVKKSMTEIDWKQIAGFRNILAHDYLGDVNLNIVWNVIDKRLPELKSAMQKIQKGML